MDEGLEELDEVELEDETDEELPERPALSLVDVGDDTVRPPPVAE